MPLSPDERALNARIAAHYLHSLVDPVGFTAAARRAFMDRFYDEVDPDRTLPEAERERRAEHARKAYFLRMALKSAQAWRERKAAREGGASA